MVGAPVSEILFAGHSGGLYCKGCGQWKETLKFDENHDARVTINSLPRLRVRDAYDSLAL